MFFQIFNFVLDWVKFNEKNRKDFFCELMKHVRLPLISKTFLVEIVSNTPLVTICFECEYIFFFRQKFLFLSYINCQKRHFDLTSDKQY